MGGFICACAHLISLGNDSILPYEGLILREQPFGGMMRTITKRLEKFVVAQQSGRRDDWVASFYGGNGAEMVKLDNETVYYDIVSYELLRCGLKVYQCEK